MTAITLEELVNKVHTALVQDAYDTNDITALMDIALNQKATVEHLMSENARLTGAIVEAGDHITKLETKIDNLGALQTAHHLVQYAEESNAN
jgi:hypothetical protein